MGAKLARRMIPLVMVVGVLVSTSTALGERVATGTLRVCLVVSPGPGAPVGSYLASPGFDGSYVSWDDVTHDPFGQSVNFGQQVGLSRVGGSSTPTSSVEGTFSHSEAAANPATFSNDAAGVYVCDDASCSATTFIGTYTSHSGTVFAGLPADAVYTFDGSTVANGGHAGVNGHICAMYDGRIAVNAFQPVATAESPPGCEATNSCAVAVTQLVEFELPDGTTGAADVDITYPQVLVAGTTTVSALSQAPGDLPTDLAIEVGGFRAAFFELETTAVYDTSSGPIEVCLPYDLGGAPFLPSQLKFLHRENGVFVDRTSRVDEVAHQICGALTSFSPVVLALPVDCHTAADCNDADPCSADSCVVGACQNVVDPECVPCNTDADCHIDSADLCTKDTCVSNTCHHALPTGCYEAGKGSLKFKYGADLGKSTLGWKFDGPGLQYGYPGLSTTYTFCLLDGSNVLASVEVPATASCAGEPCWTRKPGNAAYKDKGLTRGGIGTIKVKRNSAKQVVTIGIKAKGANLHNPTVPAPLPLTAVLWTSDSTTTTDCWKSTIQNAQKNVDGSFSGKR